MNIEKLNQPEYGSSAWSDICACAQANTIPMIPLAPEIEFCDYHRSQAISKHLLILVKSTLGEPNELPFEDYTIILYSFTRSFYTHLHNHFILILRRNEFKRERKILSI